MTRSFQSYRKINFPKQKSKSVQNQNDQEFQQEFKEVAHFFLFQFFSTEFLHILGRIFDLAKKKLENYK